MKKAFTILLLLIYSLSSFGIGLKQIYCCGILKSVSLEVGVPKAHKCNPGDETSGCCKSKVQGFKVKDDQLPTAEITKPVKPYAELHSSTDTWEDAFTSRAIATVPKNCNYPPLHNGLPIYIFNCVYRI